MIAYVSPVIAGDLCMRQVDKNIMARTKIKKRKERLRQGAVEKALRPFAVTYC